MNWDILIKEFIALWVVIDPIGSIPIFIAVTAGLSAGCTLAGFPGCNAGGRVMRGQTTISQSHIQLKTWSVPGCSSYLGLPNTCVQ